MPRRGFAQPWKFKLPSLTREFRELIWPRRGLLALGFFLVIINRLAGLVFPGATKYLVDDVIGKRDLEMLTVIVVVTGTAIAIQAVTSFSLAHLLNKTAHRLVAELRVKVQEHVGRLPVRYYDANKTGALVSRIMSDVDGVRNMVGQGLVEFLGGILAAAVACGLLFRISAALTLTVLGFLAVFTFLLSRGFSIMRPIFRDRSILYAEVMGRLNESLGGVRIVKGFHAEAREAKTFFKGAMRLFDNARKTVNTISLLSMSGNLLMGIVTLTVMVVGGRMIIRGSMTTGDFIAFTLYLAMLISPVFQLVTIGSQMTEALAGLDRMREVLAETPEDVDPERTLSLGKIRGHVRFSNVFFDYEPGKPVLHEINLETIPGTVTALVGPSGSGKSTLISLVAAFAKPTCGTILVDGTDLARVRLDTYRSQLGVVLQDNFLFDGTIRENILFGRPEAAAEDVVRAAIIARVDEFAAPMEKGYETIIGERGVKLSGGQRQRVAIARAILADPRILILDEATSSLDTESESLIQQGLAALMKGRTTFVIAHRLSTIRSADQILVLEEGRIVERGTHEELIRRRGRYLDLCTRQTGLEEYIFVSPDEKEPAAEKEPVSEDRDAEGEITELRPLGAFRRPSWNRDK